MPGAAHRRVAGAAACRAGLCPCAAGWTIGSHVTCPPDGVAGLPCWQMIALRLHPSGREPDPGVAGDGGPGGVAGTAGPGGIAGGAAPGGVVGPAGPAGAAGAAGLAGTGGLAGAPGAAGTASNGCVVLCGVAVALPRRRRSLTQRAMTSLIALEPRRPITQGGSVPEGKVSVMDEEPRNCASNVRILSVSRVHSTRLSFPIACTVQGSDKPTCMTTGSVVP